MRKILLAGMLSNGLEWYDFAIYTYMTLTISKLFFPPGDDTAHILATLGIFAVGFVARPFGGVFFGILGDKFGRRTALVLSIFMMAIPTGAIGLLPTYASIGVAAPLLLILMRLLQGLSLGGAFSGSITFLVEHAPPGRRGLIGSATVTSLVIGFLIGSILSTAITMLLTAAQFESWGWRIPFLLGVPIGFIGLYIRKYCEESPIYELAKQEGHLSATPVRDALRHEWMHMLQAIGIYMTVTMPFYMITAFFILFTEKMLGRSKEEALWLNIMNMVILLVVSPFGAWLSDRIGRKKVLVAGAVLVFLTSYPLFMLMQMPDFGAILLAQLIFTFIVAVYIGPVPALLVELFPTRIRYSSMALSYNISAAAFGGTAPMACQWLIVTTGSNYSITCYLMICAVTSLVALYFYRDRHLEPLA